MSACELGHHFGWWLEFYDKDVTNFWDKKGGNAQVVRNIEVFQQCFDAMFACWNDFSQDPGPMEWANGESAMTHTLFAGIIVDEEEEDKIMATGQGCNTCPCPKEDYFNPAKLYPPKSSGDILNTLGANHDVIAALGLVMAAACGTPAPGLV